jgi:hypothetical protein
VPEKLDKLFMATIERYNLIMEFLDKSCNSESQKQLSCILIAKLIPDLESVGFADITKLLQVVSDGVSRFDEVELDQTNVGKVISQYIKLKLKKQNIELMLKRECKDNFQDFSKISNDLDSKIEAI